MIIIYILMIIAGIVVLIFTCKEFWDRFNSPDNYLIGKILTFFQYDIIEFFILGILLIVIGLLFINGINIFKH